MSDDDSLAAILAFDTDDRQFALGFEAGRLWQMLNTDEEPLEAILHGANAEMLLRMAEATGRTVTTTEMGKDWVSANYSGREA